MSLFEATTVAIPSVPTLRYISQVRTDIRASAMQPSACGPAGLRLGAHAAFRLSSVPCYQSPIPIECRRGRGGLNLNVSSELSLTEFLLEGWPDPVGAYS
jgi:hypothetical protein